MDREKVAVIAPGALAAPSSGRQRPVERVLEKMIPHAAEQLQIRIFGIADGHLPSQGWIGNVPCYRLPGGRLYLESLLRHLRKWRPEMVDVHDRPLLAYQLKGRLPLARVLLTLHSSPFFSPSCHSKACTPQMLESVDGLIVGSEQAKAEMLEQFPTLLPPIWVNPPGASLEEHAPRWTPDGERQRRLRLAELGWTDRKIVLLAGSMQPSSRSGRLTSAFIDVLIRVPEAVLVIVGGDLHSGLRETGENRELQVLAASYPSRVMQAPEVPALKRMADWYPLAECLVILPGDEAALSQVRIEAMASAVPIVTAGSPAAFELAADSMFDPVWPGPGAEESLADRIVRLLLEEDLRIALGQAGRELVRSRCRWEHAADRWVDIVRDGRDQFVSRRSVKN